MDIASILKHIVDYLRQTAFMTCCTNFETCSIKQRVILSVKRVRKLLNVGRNQSVSQSKP